MKNLILSTIFLLSVLHSPLFSQMANRLIIYENEDEKGFWYPSGWMPGGDGMFVADNIPDGDGTCMEIGFQLANAADGWLGIYWLNDNKWDGPGENVYEYMEIDKETPVKLVFRVRGTKGGERIQFKVGGVAKASDSVRFPAQTSWLKLTTEWQEVEIDLSDKDLSNLVGGFCCVASQARNPDRDSVVFQLDSIRFEVAD